MVIYLRHETHGTKVAICDLEAAADKKNGWVEYRPEDDQQEVFNKIAKRLGRPKKAD